MGKVGSVLSGIGFWVLILIAQPIQGGRETGCELLRVSLAGKNLIIPRCPYSETAQDSRTWCIYHTVHSPYSGARTRPHCPLHCVQLGLANAGILLAFMGEGVHGRRAAG